MVQDENSLLKVRIAELEGELLEERQKQIFKYDM